MNTFPSIKLAIAERRARGEAGFVICDIIHGKVIATIPQSSDRASGSSLVEAARAARSSRDTRAN